MSVGHLPPGHFLHGQLPWTVVVTYVLNVSYVWEKYTHFNVLEQILHFSAGTSALSRYKLSVENCRYINVLKFYECFFLCVDIKPGADVVKLN